MITVAEHIRTRESALVAFLILAGITGTVLAFPMSYFGNSNVLVGLCLFPFALFISGARRNNWFYLIAFVGFGGLALIYHVRIFYFFSVALYFLWVAELFVGRLNTLILFLIAWMSPFFVQVVTILGFPVRLLLSQCAGSLLNVAGIPVEVHGNMMTLHGNSFSVDEACMGLNMLAFSLLIGVFVLAYHYRVSRRMLGLFSTGLFFVVVVALNLMTNLLRIVAMVYFQILPDDPMHEFVGILCLVVYVLIPLHFFGRWFVAKFGRATVEVTAATFRRWKACVAIMVAVGVVFIGANLESHDHAGTVRHANVRFHQFSPVLLKGGITKIDTRDLLVYVKPIPEFFTGEHTPLMCWEGSGYAFRSVSTMEVAGVTIYKGVLARNHTLLHTAWWYANGEVNTISQLDWRLRMLKGEKKFCLVNVTASEEKTLIQSIEAIFRNNELVIDPDLSGPVTHGENRTTAFSQYRQ